MRQVNDRTVRSRTLQSSLFGAIGLNIFIFSSRCCLCYYCCNRADEENVEGMKRCLLAWMDDDGCHARNNVIHYATETKLSGFITLLLFNNKQ